MGRKLSGVAAPESPSLLSQISTGAPAIWFRTHSVQLVQGNYCDEEQLCKQISSCQIPAGLRETGTRITKSDLFRLYCPSVCPCLYVHLSVPWLLGAIVFFNTVLLPMAVESGLMYSNLHFSRQFAVLLSNFKMQPVI